MWTKALTGERWRECAIWNLFFKTLKTDSMTERFLSNIFSCREISLFFMVFFTEVMSFNPR